MTSVKVFGALAIVAVTIAAIAVLPRSQGNTGTSKSKIEAVGLSKYGLDVIDPRHPTFSKLMAAKKPGLVTPFSVFVVNNSDQAITSCSLKWEIVSPDGQVNIHYE